MKYVGVLEREPISAKEIHRHEKVTNIICASVLLDMSTPDKKRVAESFDSWRNWSSASINSCFLVWNSCQAGYGLVLEEEDGRYTTSTGDRCWMTTISHPSLPNTVRDDL